MNFESYQCDRIREIADSKISNLKLEFNLSKEKIKDRLQDKYSRYELFYDEKFDSALEGNFEGMNSNEIKFYQEIREIYLEHSAEQENIFKQAHGKILDIKHGLRH